jgi:hypothetical protein
MLSEPFNDAEELNIAIIGIAQKSGSFSDGDRFGIRNGDKIFEGGIGTTPETSKQGSAEPKLNNIIV